MELAAAELAIVLSRYDIGAVQGVQPMLRGSPRSAKVVVRSDRGLFLLKRLARGPDDPARVQYTHGLQRVLRAGGFPLPALVPPKAGAGAAPGEALVLDGRTYELFEFASGGRFDASLDATRDAGRILAIFHALLVHHPAPPDDRAGSFHRAAAVAPALAAAAHTLPPSDRATPENLAALYLLAGSRVESAGFSTWPAQTLHADWHPGNMLFAPGRVLCVIDYDAAHRGERVLDVAFGALHFSLTRPSGPAPWPAHPDESRFIAFIAGYDSPGHPVLSRAEVEALPWLMIEALIAEAAARVATAPSRPETNAPGPGIDPVAVLRLVESKAVFLRDHAEHLARLLH